MNTFIEKALHGNMDSDRHLVSIFAMALASRGKVFVELGVERVIQQNHYMKQQN